MQRCYNDCQLCVRFSSVRIRIFDNARKLVNHIMRLCEGPVLSMTLAVLASWPLDKSTSHGRGHSIAFREPSCTCISSGPIPCTHLAFWMLPTWRRASGSMPRAHRIVISTRSARIRPHFPALEVARYESAQCVWHSSIDGVDG